MRFSAFANPYHDGDKSIRNVECVSIIIGGITHNKICGARYVLDFALQNDLLASVSGYRGLAECVCYVTLLTPKSYTDKNNMLTAII